MERERKAHKHKQMREKERQRQRETEAERISKREPETKQQRQAIQKPNKTSIGFPAERNEAEVKQTALSPVATQYKQDNGSQHSFFFFFSILVFSQSPLAV